MQDSNCYVAGTLSLAGLGEISYHVERLTWEGDEVASGQQSARH